MGEMPTEDGKMEVVAVDASMGANFLVNTNAMMVQSFSGGDYSKADFPELDWIQNASYDGIGSPDENPYYVFRTNGAPTASKAQRQDLTMPEAMRPKAQPKDSSNVPVQMLQEARIDVSTKLPVSSDDGYTIRTYTFSSDIPPLTLPSRYQEVLNQLKADVESAKHRRLPNS